MATINVTIRGMSGSVLAVVQADPSQTVQELKESIAAQSGVATNKQKLLGATCVLNNVLSVEAAIPSNTGEAELTLVITDRWVQEVANDWRRLRKAPLALRNDPETVLDAIERSQGEAFKFAGEDVRGNKAIASAALVHNPALHEYVMGNLHTDAEFVAFVVERVATLDRDQRLSANVWRWPWNRLKDLCTNRRFMLCVVCSNVYMFQYFHEDLRSDRELALAAVREDGAVLEFVAGALREDPEIARVAMDSKAAFAFRHVSEALRADRDFVAHAFQAARAQPFRGSAMMLKYASMTLRSDREIVNLAIETNAFELRYASQELRGDRAVMELAIQSNPQALSLADEALQRDQVFMLPLIKQQPHLWTHLCDFVRNHDRDLALTAAEHGVVGWTDTVFSADADFMLEVIKKSPREYLSIAEPLKARQDLALAAIQKDWTLYKHLASKLQNNRVVVTAAAQSRGNVRCKKALEKMTVAAIVQEYLSLESK